MNDPRSAPTRRLGFALAAILATACARVPEHFELPELEVKQAEFAATLGAYTGTGVVGGNRVAILLNGEEIFPATLALIRRAKRTVNYAQYYYASHCSFPRPSITSWCGRRAGRSSAACSRAASGSTSTRRRSSTRRR